MGSGTRPGRRGELALECTPAGRRPNGHPWRSRRIPHPHSSACPGIPPSLASDKLKRLSAWSSVRSSRGPEEWQWCSRRSSYSSAALLSATAAWSGMLWRWSSAPEWSTAPWSPWCPAARHTPTASGTPAGRPPESAQERTATGTEPSGRSWRSR